MYETVSNLRLASADYALYQRGVIAGAMNKNAEKVSLLQSLEKQFPASALIRMRTLKSPILIWQMKISRLRCAFAKSDQQ
jgi:hypothetical protein